MWHPDLLLNEHPEWQELNSPDAQPFGPADRKAHWNVNGCWISPFGDFYIRQCALFAEKFGWDGYNLDGFGTFTVCYCPTCRQVYREETGTDLPRGRDINDPAFRRYVKWRLARWTDYVYRWQKAVKAVNADFASVPWSTERLEQRMYGRERRSPNTSRTTGYAMRCSPR